VTESEIRAAFTPDYEGFVTDLTIMENPLDVWSVDAKVWDDGNRHAPVANYTRTINIPHSCVRHEVLLVEKAYRYQGLSRDLQIQSFALYRKHGLRFVDLDAADDGIFVWPRRGWSPINSGLTLVHEAIRSIYQDEFGATYPEDTLLPTFGPAIVAHEFGARALQKLKDAGYDLIPMRLDLQDPETIAFLAGKGIV
jgi:hypothetical protein